MDLASQSPGRSPRSPPGLPALGQVGTGLSLLSPTWLFQTHKGLKDGEGRRRLPSEDRIAASPSRRAFVVPQTPSSRRTLTGLLPPSGLGLAPRWGPSRLQPPSELPTGSWSLTPPGKPASSPGGTRTPPEDQSQKSPQTRAEIKGPGGPFLPEDTTTSTPGPQRSIA